MQVLFLGTGNAFASGGRNQMAILVQTTAGGTAPGLLLDCGPTTLTALKRYARGPSVVDAIAISHHHGDHFGGIPMVVVHEAYDGARRKPLTVLGPPGTADIVAASCALFYPSLDSLPFSLEAKDGAPLQEENVSALSVRAFEVDHFSSGVAYGYRVTDGKKTLVFSGDTAWTDALAEETEGADLFICECSSFDQPLDKHMSHRDLVSHRERIGAKRTLLVHPGDDVLARRNDLVYELADDGMEVSL
jgi:ribonuclease BN (tRNA processing enzyme)